MDARSDPLTLALKRKEKEQVKLSGARQPHVSANKVASTIWDEKSVKTLKEMWDRGETAAVIGAALNRSRNAVIGKADRLNLPPSKVPNNTPTQRTGAINSRKTRSATPKPKPTPIFGLDSRPLNNDAFEPLPYTQPTLLVATKGCMWPVGEHFFCNAAKGAGPYCEHHAEKARYYTKKVA